MAVYHGITSVAVLVSLGILLSVHSQDTSFITPVELELRNNLTKLVQFVVHPSAKSNMDLINLALASGGEPKSEQDRMMYFRILKTIAKNTPDLVKQFTTTHTLPDGKLVNRLNVVGIDAHVTLRSKQYLQQQQRDVTLAANTQVNAVNTSVTAPVEIITDIGFNGAAVQVGHAVGDNSAKLIDLYCAKNESYLGDGLSATS